VNKYRDTLTANSRFFSYLLSSLWESSSLLIKASPEGENFHPSGNNSAATRGNLLLPRSTWTIIYRAFPYYYNRFRIPVDCIDCLSMLHNARNLHNDTILNFSDKRFNTATKFPSRTADTYSHSVLLRKHFSTGPSTREKFKCHEVRALPWDKKHFLIPHRETLAMSIPRDEFILLFFLRARYATYPSTFPTIISIMDCLVK